MILNRKLEFFISVVEKGSFSKAAKLFLLSQSAISQQISQLEEELGVILFDRKGYRPILTEAGQYFYEQCKKLIADYVDIENTTKKIAKQNKQILSIGILGPLEKKHLPRIVLLYKKKYPSVIIDMKKITFGSGVKEIENQTLEIAFGITNDFKGITGIGIVNLLKHKVCVICSKSHPWAIRHSVNSAEIAGEPIISFSKKLGIHFYADFLDSFKRDGITPNIVQYVDDLEELILAVKINQGIALISREVIEKDDDVCMLDIENTHHHADFCLGFLTNNNKNYVKAFIEETTNYFNLIK